MKDFFQIFGDSFRDWKNDIKFLFGFGLLYYFIPSSIVGIIGTILQQSLIGKMFSFILTLISILLTVFFTLAIVIYLLNKKKINSNYTLKNMTLKKFWPFVVFSIILGFAIFFGLLFLIIPGIILAVYLMFAMIIFVQKKNIERFPLETSFKDSYNLVKGRWWRTFGFLLLEAIIIFIPIFILVIILAGVIGAIAFFTIPSFAGVIVSIIISVVMYFVSLFTTTFGNRFLYNLYLDYK